MPIHGSSRKHTGGKAPQPEARRYAKFAAVLDSRGIVYDHKWGSGKLWGMEIRSDRGPLDLTKCTRDELLRFCFQRDIKCAQIDSDIYTNDDLIMLLEEADEEPKLGRFLELPSELRNMVYEQALLHRGAGKPAPIGPENEESYKHSLQTLALTQTSRSICEESLPLYYSMNTFRMDDSTNYSGLTAKWLTLISQHAVRHIRHISRSIDTVCDHYDDEGSPNATLLINLSGPTTEVRHDDESGKNCKICAKEEVGVKKMLEVVEEEVERKGGVPQVTAEVLLAIIRADVVDSE